MQLRVVVVFALLTTSVSGFEIVREPFPSAPLWQPTQCGGPTGNADIRTRWADDVIKTVREGHEPLGAYPRPQLVRATGHPVNWLPRTSELQGLRDDGDPSSWASLNGFWEWWPVSDASTPAPILVPFPVEACLSGVAPNRSADIVEHMGYRLRFAVDAAPEQGHRTLLHFGAVDWSTSVHLNGEEIGSHVGGYDGFSFDITDQLTTSINELKVFVYDPSDNGNQPNGKQRSSSIDKPGGDTYTPNSGIWQTVWLERVPRNYIKLIKIDQASTTAVKVTVEIASELTGNLSIGVLDDGKPLKYVDFVDAGQGQHEALLTVPDPKLWSPEHPYLYDLKITFGDDLIFSYFGLRTFTVGQVPSWEPRSSVVTRPLLNGAFTFLAGFLDQSWWPDGQYTAPTDEALESDLVVTKEFGLNMIRLHQKVNPERWYYHADRHGLIVFQDMIQKYGRATQETVPLFQSDLAAMVVGRGNHPCIVQWTLFNEADCWAVFNTTPGLPYMVEYLRSLDPTRPIDTDSGGGANDYHLADVNDIHTYPFPGDPAPSATQYAMVGEYGGLGIFVKDKEWVSGGCYGYLPQKTIGEGASTYVNMTSTFIKNIDRVSAAVYTQTTDVELECDGFLNYDRSHKFTEEQRKSIRNANIAMIEASKPGVRERVFV